VLQRLRDTGVEEIVAYGVYDLVCAELCGLGHSRMQGQFVVADPEEYRQRFAAAEADPAAGAPAGPSQ
jgi:heme/copper-type cytochrome/quinol oxidase subunit 2